MYPIESSRVLSQSPHSRRVRLVSTQTLLVVFNDVDSKEDKRKEIKGPHELNS